MATHPQNQHLINQAQLLLSRLERLSADSIWAHRASGVRGALLKMIDCLAANPDLLKNEIELKKYRQLIKWGFFLLEKAAQEKLT
jgi:hypothetical protein